MIVYSAINTINGKQYIGKTVNTLNQRIVCHLSSVKHNANPNSKFYRAIRKYGAGVFVWKILEVCVTEDELNERERILINNHDTIRCGYNIAEGGTGGDVTKGYTEEQYREFCRKSSVWNTLDKDSPKGKALRLKYSNAGITHPLYGKKQPKLKKMVEDMNQQEMECPVCHKVGKNFASMHRWHFDNCKESHNV